MPTTSSGELGVSASPVLRSSDNSPFISRCEIVAWAFASVACANGITSGATMWSNLMDEAKALDTLVCVFASLSVRKATKAADSCSHSTVVVSLEIARGFPAAAPSASSSSVMI